MKNLFLLTGIMILAMQVSIVKSQEAEPEKLNLPGDNLNLYAVMKLFQESETLEGFEKSLNAEDSKINNLDLNGDDKIDYIKVIDYVNGEDHTIVLQVPVNEKEQQDVATFTVQKNDKNEVQVQLIGDEDLYGKDYIIEPYYDETANETPNPGYKAKSADVDNNTVKVTKTTFVEVAAWPVIHFIFLPTYVRWHSPWYWGYYPPYWNPWRPYYWDYYYGYHYHYHPHYYGHYRHWKHYRYPHWRNNYYHAHRSSSTTYRNHRDSGKYNTTYSRPDMREQGKADYKQRNPNTINSNNVQSKEINNNGKRPDINQNNQSINPINTKPLNPQNDVRPTTKPKPYKPNIENKEVKPQSKPESKPNRTNTYTKPTSKPSSTPKVNNSKPSSRPSGNSRSSSQPSPSRSGGSGTKSR